MQSSDDPDNPDNDLDAHSILQLRKMGQMAMEDLPTASKQLRKALRLRAKYMDCALQSFPHLTRRFIDPTHTSAFPATDASSQHSSQADGQY